MAIQKRYGFVIDVSRCIDCRACLVACSVENQVPMNHTRIWVQDLGVKGEFPSLSRTFIPYNCMHCENPPCTEVCVSGATYKDKDTGLVLVDQEACIGCGFCVEACPYGARYIDENRGVVDKCTGCIQRLEIGEQPACVATCVGHSRMFGDLNNPASDVSIALKNAKTILRLDYENNGQDTDPNIYYINAPEMESLISDDAFGQVSGTLPRDPQYTIAEDGWKKVLVPLILTGIGASFAVQATYFTKQLIEGEKEFED
jgi:tetrathionate reductase subunit B